MSPLLQALLLGGDDPSKVGSISNRMFALRFAPEATFGARIPSGDRRLPQFPTGQLWVPDSQGKPQRELVMPQELPLLLLSSDSILSVPGQHPAGKNSTCECPGTGEAICHLPSPECHPHSHRAPRGFICTHISLGHSYHGQHLLWIPSPLLKNPARRSWHCFRQQWIKTSSLTKCFGAKTTFFK